MIYDPMIGSITERNKALARQLLAANGFRVVASAGFGDCIPALLRATVSAGVPASIFASLSDDELMLDAQTVGGQYRQRGRLVHFEHVPDGWHPVEAGEPLGVCDPDDAIALQAGHTPCGHPGGWDIPA